MNKKSLSQKIHDFKSLRSEVRQLINSQSRENDFNHSEIDALSVEIDREFQSIKEHALTTDEDKQILRKFAEEELKSSLDDDNSLDQFITLANKS